VLWTDILRADSPDRVEAMQQAFPGAVRYETARVTHRRGPAAWLARRFDWRLMLRPQHLIIEKDRGMCEELLATHDLVWFRGGLVADSFGHWNYPRSILDIDDLEHKKLIGKPANSLRGRLSQHEAWLRLKRYEQAYLDRFSILCTCSQDDRRYMGDSDRVHVIRNGAVMPQTEPTWTAPIPGRFGFLGKVSYGPNAEGLDWFARKVWPLIRQAMPKAHLRVAGKNQDNRANLDYPGFDPLGYVEDLASEVATWTCMIVPLLRGGGTRLKILDAFSMKVPVVSTTLGAYGHEVQDGRELCMADTPTAFAEACLTLTRQSHRAREIAEEAWRFFVAHGSWESIAPDVFSVVKHCIELSQKPGP